MPPLRSMTIMKCQMFHLLGPYREVILGNAPKEHNSHEGPCVPGMGAGLAPLSQAAGTGHKGTLWGGGAGAAVSSKVHLSL